MGCTNSRSVQTSEAKKKYTKELEDIRGREAKQSPNDIQLMSPSRATPTMHK